MIGRIARGPVLFIFRGCPAQGNPRSHGLARQTGAVYIRVDTIEQALRDLCSVGVEAEGYQLGYRIAMDNLRVGLSVIADSCNPIEPRGGSGGAVALDAGAPHMNIEVVCSDIRQHRDRVNPGSATCRA